MTIAAGLAPRAVSTPVVLRRRPTLTLVQVGVTAAPRAPFIAVVVSLLVAGLLGLLVLNTVLAKDAFRLHTLQIEARQLADTEQVLIREVEALRSSSALAAKATEMGMVQGGPPTFLQLTDGVVLGAAEPAVDPELEAAPAPAATEPEAAVADETDPEDG